MGVTRGAVVMFAFGAAAACAEVLGIDDGIPRSYDGSTDATLDVTTPDDAHVDVVSDAGADTFSPLHCGGATCNRGAGESCCWSDAGYACVAANGACSGVDVPCDRPEQCAQGDAGVVTCCATYASTDAGAIANAVACLPESQCDTQLSRFILCGNDDAGDCLPDASCVQSTFTLPTFYICK